MRRLMPIHRMSTSGHVEKTSLDAEITVHITAFIGLPTTTQIITSIGIGNRSSIYNYIILFVFFLGLHKKI